MPAVCGITQSNGDGTATRCAVVSALLRDEAGDFRFATGGILRPDDTLEPDVQALIDTLREGARLGSAAIATVTYEDSHVLCGRVAGIALEIRGRELILSGTRPPESGEDRVYQQLEIEHGPFRRVVSLGADVDADAASAAYEDGMLIVELPLAPPARPQSVRIEPERRDGP